MGERDVALAVMAVVEERLLAMVRRSERRLLTTGCDSSWKSTWRSSPRAAGDVSVSMSVSVAIVLLLAEDEVDAALDVELMATQEPGLGRLA